MVHSYDDNYWLNFYLGYGDIVPISINEKIFTIISIFVSCIIFGYTLNRIGQIFSESDDKE